MSLSWFGNTSRRCDGVNRRAFVRIGSLAALGITIWHFHEWQTLGAASRRGPDVGTGREDRQEDRGPGRARRCIMIWLDGGPSHLETFDPKPEAAREVRGPFETIATAIPGVGLGECLPRLAAVLDQVTLIRSLTSPLGEHNLATQYLLTGHLPSPAINYPVMGSVVSHLSADAERELPHFVSIPHHRVGSVEFPAAGYLSSRHQPFETGGDPKNVGFSPKGLRYFDGLTAERLRRRTDFVQQLNAVQARLDDQSDKKKGSVWRRAAEMLTGPQVRAAFSLETEPQHVRQRYGMTTVGQGCLLARRLIERGVQFVTVNFPGWDTHDGMMVRLKDGYAGATDPVGLIPQLDLALTGLLNDLSSSGLLDETLVVVMGEFGRTPKINPAGGRDHWPRAYSALLAGGGVPAGAVIGATDRHGQIPVSDPISPADLVASIYWLLGIDPQTVITTSDGRPIPIVHGGRLIRGLAG